MQTVPFLSSNFLISKGRSIEPIIFACPVCVKTRGMQDAKWVANAEVAGVPSVLEYTTGGALVFNY